METIPSLACWAYGSVRAFALEEEEATLAAIVAVSRRRNAALDVTGALIFTGTRFAQYLEGPPAALHELRRSIGRDPRHRELSTFASQAVERREFGDWSLAFSRHSGPYDDLLAFASKRRPGTAVRLLRGMLQRFSAEP